MTVVPSRFALVLSLAALATALFMGAEYHHAILAGEFIARHEMAALGAAALLAVVTVSSTLLAATRVLGWFTPAPITYRRQELVNGPVAAFTLGMFVYLSIYPPTPWVFDTMTALAFVFGFMLMLPVGVADAPAAIAVLNACTGLAAAAAGFASGNGVLMMAGAVVAAAGATFAIIIHRPTSRPAWRTLVSAFAPAEPRTDRY
jgi:proton-translocating NAD(P)+ transhydrogenase subunit beta